MSIQKQLSIAILVIVFIFCERPLKADSNSEAIKNYKFPASISNEETFVSTLPKGVDSIALTYGDLNDDGLSDLIIVVANNSETAEFDSPVQLGAYLKNANSTYDLIVQSSSAVLCLQCGGAFGNPFSGIEINNKGKLVVYHYGGSSDRWAYSDEYTYMNGNLYLTGHLYTTSNTFSLAYTSVSTNYVTGEQVTTTSNGETDKKKYKDKVARKKLKVKPLVSIDKYSPGG